MSMLFGPSSTTTSSVSPRLCARAGEATRSSRATGSKRAAIRFMTALLARDGARDMPGSSRNEIGNLATPGSQKAGEWREDEQGCLELAQRERRQVEEAAATPGPERLHGPPERRGSRAEQPGEGPAPGERAGRGPALRRDRREIGLELLGGHAPA